MCPCVTRPLNAHVLVHTGMRPFVAVAACSQCGCIAIPSPLPRHPRLAASLPRGPCLADLPPHHPHPVSPRAHLPAALPALPCSLSAHHAADLQPYSTAHSGAALPFGQHYHHSHVTWPCSSHHCHRPQPPRAM